MNPGNESFEHEYKLQILERHLDIFGHVNNAIYFVIFEEARWDWITRGGFGLSEVQKRGIGPVILEAHARFQRELTNPEKIVIRSRTLEYRGKLARMEQIMYRSDGKPACSAEFVFGLFDLKARKLIDPTPEWLKAIGRAP
jgi:acyl-CoA thioester hydrolase